MNISTLPLPQSFIIYHCLEIEICIGFASFSSHPWINRKLLKPGPAYLYPLLTYNCTSH
jgi:hypothetical protein